ncbi:MAG: PAS domain S-box protein [Candidatus Hydrogenedentes bacterium]|nr:PAS domain S-box protein [Candidatus Hydrogenedentota bacterium]
MIEETLSYEMLLDQLYDGVYFADHAGVITFWNRGAERITGHLRQEMVGKAADSATLPHCDDKGISLFDGRSPVLISMERQALLERELFLRHKDGSLVPVVTRVSPILNSLGDAIGAIEVFSDNSSRLNAMKRIEELEEMALICPLTGAGNRRYAQLALENAIEELKRYNWPFGLLFVDIDFFKNINDQDLRFCGALGRGGIHGDSAQHHG